MSSIATAERALVAHASRHGSTREVAEAVGAVLTGRGLSVDELPAREVEDVSCFDLVVLGGALYLGRWHPEARAFLARHRHALHARPLAVFALGPKTLAEQDVAASRKQLEAALARVADLRPAAIAIFGGVIRPQELRFPLNRLEASDARDWDAIESWAGEVAALVPAAAAAATRGRIGL